MSSSHSAVSPKHYDGKSVSLIDYIEDAGMCLHLASAVQYVTRHLQKNGLEDLNKAKWYLDRMAWVQIVLDQQAATPITPGFTTVWPTDFLMEQFFNDARIPEDYAPLTTDHLDILETFYTDCNGIVTTDDPLVLHHKTGLLAKTVEQLMEYVE